MKRTWIVPLLFALGLVLWQALVPSKSTGAFCIPGRCLVPGVDHPVQH